ncbi:MAG: DegT/DnrJ/EryC1/StrS family aminotransferase [Bacteroidetes bacterium]|nr:DegT/DnrJ/EryC1/StrS family aminotransferase [Bacteroidota bacterium]
MRVPLLDLQLQYQTIQSEIEPVLLRVAQSQALILGKDTADLEQTLAHYCGAKFALGVSSGTDALLMALMALDLEPDDEVIMPTYSFFATAGVAARLRAKPIFVDSEPITLNINPDAIRAVITSRTKAIIPVHLYGQSAAMDEILAIGNEFGIPIIEDAAQAIGTHYQNGLPVGSMGLMGCFSFYPTKNLGAFGDAGLLTTNDETLYKKLRQMRDHGMEPRYYHKFVGGNFRMDAIQAAVLNVKFPHLESWHEARRRNANLYETLFCEQGLAQEAGKTAFDEANKVLLPAAIYKSSGVKNYHIYNQFIIRVERRDELREFLKSNDIGAEIYYPVPFHRQECFQYLNPIDSDFPVANFAADTSLALPIFPELRTEQIYCVVEKIAEFIRG